MNIERYRNIVTALAVVVTAVIVVGTLALGCSVYQDTQDAIRNDIPEDTMAWGENQSGYENITLYGNGTGVAVYENGTRLEYRNNTTVNVTATAEVGADG